MIYAQTEAKAGYLSISRNSKSSYKNMKDYLKSRFNLSQRLKASVSRQIVTVWMYLTSVIANASQKRERAQPLIDNSPQTSSKL